MANKTINEADRMSITRVFDAPRSLVWKAWTDPQYVKQWWGPKGFTSPVCKMDFRVGGKFLICMRTPDGNDLFSGGEYVEIVPEEKIVSFMYFADADGNKVQPEHYGIEMEADEQVPDITLFEDLGDGRTKLTFIGNSSKEDATSSGEAEGWNQIFDKVADLLAGMTTAK